MTEVKKQVNSFIIKDIIKDDSRPGGVYLTGLLKQTGDFYLLEGSTDFEKIANMSNGYNLAYNYLLFQMIEDITIADPIELQIKDIFYLN